MKIMIVGAGIIGTIYGWAFTQAGHDVTHLVRPGRAGQFPRGIDIDMYDLRKGHPRDFLGHYPIRLSEGFPPGETYDPIIVPTKHYHLLETLGQLVPQAGQSDFWLLTQNWDGTAGIDAQLPASRYVFGDAKAGGKFEGDRLIATLASVDVGQAGGRHDACLDKVRSLCASAQIGVTVRPEMLHYLWVQYAITGGLWPALVRGGSLEAALTDRQIGEQAFRAVRECLQVVARRGVDLGRYPETKMYFKSGTIGMWIAGQTIRFMFRHNKLVQRSSAHGLSDAEEVRAFYYDLLRTGRELGVDMPALAGFENDIRDFKPTAE